METSVAVGSALVALASAIVSAWLAVRANRLAERSARDAYLERVREWAEATIDVVVGLGRLCADPGTDSEAFLARRHDLLTQLSSQIEKGRWFFPNVLAEQVGEWKEAAYRGFRQPILDHLVAAFDAADSVRWNDAAGACASITAAQRTFVSEIQLRLDPKRRDEEYQTLVDRYEDLTRFVHPFPPLSNR